MERRDNPLRNLIREIHRRSLWQVLAIYVVASWVVLQVVETLGGIVALPEWFGGLAVGLLVLGLPIVLATTFMQEGGAVSEEAETGGTGEGPVEPSREVVAVEWLRYRMGDDLRYQALLDEAGITW